MMKKITLGMAISIALSVGSIAGEVRANGFNNLCQPAGNAPEEWQIVKTFKFDRDGRSYRLIYSRMADGTGSLCLGSGGKFQPIGSKYWIDEYLDKLDRTSDKIYTFQVHAGNGSPITYRRYRLDLTRPQQPKFSLLKTWVEKYP
jgi:hypothetical protein